MKKAREAMDQDIRLIDVIIELVDARIPLASMNPEIRNLSQGRGRVIILNKADLADPAMNNAWKSYFKEQGIVAISLDSRSRNGMRAIEGAIQEAAKAKIERDRRRGILNRPLRAMIAGIPNVGKSTFINSYARKAVAKTGNKPGVTKGKQWVRLTKTVELLDTPGILWPKISDEAHGFHLALIGTMNDDNLDKMDMACRFLKEMREGPNRTYWELVKEKYGLEDGMSDPELLKTAAMQRLALKSGGEPDMEKAAAFILDDLRAGRIGQITLERPKKL